MKSKGQTYYTITNACFGDYYIKVVGERFSVFKTTPTYKSAAITHQSNLISAIECIKSLLLKNQYVDKVVELDTYIVKLIEINERFNKQLRSN
jgi:hypothetical protein